MRASLCMQGVRGGEGGRLGAKPCRDEQLLCAPKYKLKRLLPQKEVIGRGR